MRQSKLVTVTYLLMAIGASGCGDSGDGERASGAAATGEALEDCLVDEGFDVQRYDTGPIRFPPAGTFTPQAVLVHSSDGEPDSVPRQDIVVLEEEDAETYDKSFPRGARLYPRFGANVLVFVTEVAAVETIQDYEPSVVPSKLRRALNSCVP